MDLFGQIKTKANMKTIIQSLTLICVLALVLLGCKKDEYRGPDLNLDASLKISSFAVGSINGTVSDSAGTVAIVFPFGYDRTAVAPTITIPSNATISPASGTTVNLTNGVTYRVSNGNIYSDYKIIPTEQKAILSFVVAGVTATIDESSRTIKASVPLSSDLTALSPTITMASGATISPASAASVDFTNPVTYTVKMGTATVSYKVTIVKPQAVAFVGTAETVALLTNPDEKAAWTWLASVNSEAQYVSFSSIKSGSVDLSKFSVVWWHWDEAQNLPAIATDAAVLNALTTYYANGGNFLLTSFGGRYVESLGIVPSGKGPNNSFGDATPWLEANWAWGLSYAGHETHPAFAGLPLTSDKPYATTYFLSAGTYRLNHTAQWYVPDWGGYGTIANWRSQTGGIDLASSEGNADRSSTVTMAEFPKTTAHGAAIVIVSGSYDWYSEANPTNSADQPVNTYLPNIKKMTDNILEYLGK